MREKVAMQAVPVLLVTQDDFLWQHWSRLPKSNWQPERGTSLQHLARWRELGRSLILLDSGLPGLPAWSDTAWGKYARDTKIVVTSTRLSDEEGKQVLAAGAYGYVHTYSPVEALSTVLQTVAAGGIWMGPTLLARLLRQIDQNLPRQEAWAEGLTQREREVAERAAIGHSNQAIAEALNITERTVRAHLSAVFQKLGVNDRLMLALKVHGIN